ncbi:SCP2 sterol-binding domain-containing protein [Glycomyces xiaoerkulensis]|uniref:SCP2 sterol-binding domain-containing protein n=1 Tax=Glycomyces xiaoerkulensis TaxID=2038139 RepID=UPI000C2618D6|nr:SCP2 sterol-binding domain-containing protein [Glycomyces xiaoerkulensis]
MATVDECRNVLEKMAGKVAKKSGDFEGLEDFERTLACEITDLDTSFSAKLSNGSLTDLIDGDDSDAEVRISIASDDLIKLSKKQLKPAKAFLTGKVKVKASVKDLAKLRKALKVD